MNKHWQEQLKKTWGIDASLTSLDGEFDLNFKASTQDGRQYLTLQWKIQFVATIALNHFLYLSPDRLKTEPSLNNLLLALRR